jgi:hypothetical protein
MKSEGESRVRAHPASLVKMLEIDDSTQREWRDAEVGAMLCHQLAAPLATELKLAPARREELSKALIVTFADLISAASPPPLWLLEETKQFAKANLSQTEGPLKQVATLLYYVAIAGALVRHGQRITDLNDDQLKQGLDWAQAQPWATSVSGLRALMEQAVAPLARR